MKIDKRTLILLGGFMILGLHLRERMHSASTSQILIVVAIFAGWFGFAVAASVWVWKPLIARFGYYRACAIFCACLFVILAPVVCEVVELCSFTSFYRDIIYDFAAGAGIGSWFISIERNGPQPKPIPNDRA